MDQLFTFLQIVEGAWEFANPVGMCFVDLEKAYDTVSQGILWEVQVRAKGLPQVEEYRYWGPVHE